MLAKPTSVIFNSVPLEASLYRISAMKWSDNNFFSHQLLRPSLSTGVSTRPQNKLH